MSDLANRLRDACEKSKQAYYATPYLSGHGPHVSLRNDFALSLAAELERLEAENELLRRELEYRDVCYGSEKTPEVNRE